MNELTAQISPAVIWLAAGLIFAGIDIFAGTFYLLVMGASCLLAALAAWGGFELGWQCTVFAVAMIIGGVAVRRLRIKAPEEAEALQHPDVGQKVQVSAWNDDATALVMYRGAQWTAVAAQGTKLEAGLFVIERVDGARLVLKNAE